MESVLSPNLVTEIPWQKCPVLARIHHSRNPSKVSRFTHYHFNTISFQLLRDLTSVLFVNKALLVFTISKLLNYRIDALLTRSQGMYTYDYLLTFGQEVRTMWGHKPGGLGVLLLVSRYSNLVLLLINIPYSSSAIPVRSTTIIYIEFGVLKLLCACSQLCESCYILQAFLSS